MNAVTIELRFLEELPVCTSNQLFCSAVWIFSHIYHLRAFFRAALTRAKSSEAASVDVTLELKRDKTKRGVEEIEAFTSARKNKSRIIAVVGMTCMS